MLISYRRECRPIIAVILSQMVLNDAADFVVSYDNLMTTCVEPARRLR